VVDLPAFLGRYRLGERPERRDGPGRDRAEVPLDQLPRLFDPEVAGHHEGGVAGGVELVEEGHRLVDGGRLQVDEAAVAVVGVGERREHDRREGDPGEPSEGLVDDVDPDLLFDDGDLVLDVVVVQAQAPHPVGLEVETELEGVGRELLVVVGVVGAGAAVHDPAVAGHELVVLALLQGHRPFEHEVLEEVGEAGHPLRLGPEADVVDDGDRHGRGRRVGHEHDPETVSELEALDGEGGRGEALAARGGGHGPNANAIGSAP
jgi:hypothetical protein